MTQVKLRTSTIQERSAGQPQKLYVAGAGRGNSQCLPICISYQEPADSNQGQQEESCRRQTRINRLLQTIDMPRCRGGRPHLPIQGCLPDPQFSQAKQLGLPSFVIAELCGRLVFTTWDPWCMWPQTAVEGGTAW